MDEFITYDVISHHDQKAFIDQVQRALERGWKLQGGVSVTAPPNGNGHYHFYQAVYFKEK
jgi:hypothetical protein